MRHGALASGVAVALAVAAMPGSVLAQQQAGGAVTVLSVGDIDSLDPGLTHSPFGSQVSNAVSRQLYAFVPGDAEAPSPDLALDPPEVTDDGRTITVRLRSGVKYAPPVNREVVAADVKYALERAFSARVPNPYVHAEFHDVVGAPRRPTRGIPSISGIVAADEHTLVLHLNHATAASVGAALSLPVTAPVPPEYAGQFDKRSPSTYADHVVATGPYVARHKRGRAIYLTRNPNWVPASDVRPAHLNAITVDERSSDGASAARRTLNGSRRLAAADVRPGPAQAGSAIDTRPGQVRQTPAGSTRYVALNTRVAPFNNPNVRRAVLAGFDRSALFRARGGKQVGALATHFLAPGTPGYTQVGGAGGAGVDFLDAPAGSRTLAARYFRRAGFRKGRYTGRRPLLLVGTTAQPGRQVAERTAANLERLGFRLRVKLLAPQVAEQRYCERPKARVAVCPNAVSLRSVDDPESQLRAVFDGTRIASAANLNWSLLDDPRINRAMGAAALLPAGAERLSAWADVDRQIVRTAPAIPYMWDDATLVQSADVDGAVNELTGGWDLSFTRLR